MAWRLVDHTADVAIEATAIDMGTTLAQAALALTSVLSGKSDVRQLGAADGERTFTVEAPDMPSLAVAFLAELVWLAESEDVLWLGGGVVAEPDGPGYVARARGNVLHHDADRHGRGVEIKAVTYHDLAFERRGAEFFLRVVLDL